MPDFEPAPRIAQKNTTCGNPRTTPKHEYELSNEYGVARVICTGTCSDAKVGHDLALFRQRPVLYIHDSSMNTTSLQTVILSNPLCLVQNSGDYFRCSAGCGLKMSDKYEYMCTCMRTQVVYFNSADILEGIFLAQWTESNLRRCKIVPVMC